MNILVINSGSSSVKFQLFKGSRLLKKGMIEKIGTDSNKMTHQKAVEQILTGLEKYKIDAIGHRVVHGGEKYKNATLINSKIIAQIKRLSELAPLHNPSNLAGILACKAHLPQVPQVAIFDTAFHQTIPRKAFLYAIPYSYYKKLGIRRYGFHGTSHKYVSRKAAELLGKSGKIIICHLGNGSSITAVKNGKSVDTSMGFTPLEGLPMGTRCGNLDPSIIFFLQKKLKINTDEINHILNTKSGFKGLSGISSDMREIHKKSLKGDKRARFIIEYLSYQLAKYIGAYTASMNGLDAIAFTAGIGQWAFYVRKKTCDYLKHLGVKLNASKNRKHELKIHARDSKIKIFVIPTNEELQIAKETSAVVSSRKKW